MSMKKLLAKYGGTTVPVADLTGGDSDLQAQLTEATEALTASAEENKSLTQALTGASGEIATLTASLATANGTIAEMQTLGKLEAKAEKLNYEGDVKALLEANNGDYSSALEAMIDHEPEAIAPEENTFLADSGNSAGGNDTDDEETPKSSSQAVKQVMNLQGLSRREATEVARSSYPTLFGEVTK